MTGSSIEERPLVVAVTGASGAPYAVRFIDRAIALGLRLEVVISAPARRVLRLETDDGTGDGCLGFGQTAGVTLHENQDVGARIASGSCPTRGMIVIPCSTGTLGRIAGGVSSCLIERAADVHLKERRPLVLVVRETPLNTIHLENMARLSRAGATVLPAAPGFYGRPRTIDDLLDFIVVRAFLSLGVPCEGGTRWTGDTV